MGISAIDLIDQVKSFGARIVIDGAKARVVPPGKVPPDLIEQLRDHREAIETQCRRDEALSALDYAGRSIGFALRPISELVDELQAQDFYLGIGADGALCDCGIRENLTTIQLRELYDRGKELMIYLADRQNPKTTGRGVMCAFCRRIRLCFTIDDGRTVCAECVEWRCIPCHPFVILQSIEVERAKRAGLCITCGFRWVEHGRPAPSSWMLIDDPDSVPLRNVYCVLARAQEIGRGEAP